MRHTLLALLICFSFPLISQDEEEGEKKFCKEISKDLEKLYEKGTNRKTPKPERLKYLKQCLDEDPDFAEANLRMGFELIVHLKLEEKPFAPARPYFMKAIAQCPDIHSEPYYYIGFGYYEEYKNDSAIKYLNKFIKFTSSDDKKFGKDYEAEMYNAKEMVKSAKKEDELNKLTVPFDPKVVKGVSTERDEYLAYISPDNQNCLFVRKMPLNSKNVVYDQTDREKEVFVRARKDNTGVFDKGEEMPWPFNATEDNQGGCTITMDNKYLYFAMMRFEGGAQANCDIYVSRNVEDEWKPFSKMPFCHPVYWDSQPTVSADGNTIVFASDRPGGFGGIDLYQSVRDPKTGVWGPATNLGPKVNTPGEEKTPFLHTDSKTLYFSSGPNKQGVGGHYGFGGYDIFYIRKNEKGEWLEAKNIGKPINGPTDDTGFFVSTDAQNGYFVSFEGEKFSGRGVGRYDLYSFPLYAEARPEEMALTGGKAVDKDGEPIRGAQIEVKTLGTNEKIKALADSATGEFMFAINAKKHDKVVVSVKKEGMVYNSAVVDVKKAVAAFANPPKVKASTNPDEPTPEPDKPIMIKMDSVKVGGSFVINDIYYNSNSAELTEESKKVLEEFAGYLKDNPKMIIEIQGHTDNVGAAAANQALSANRAFTVKASLEGFGITGDRIKAKGFGASKPIADNSSETGRAKNRRTEFLIIEN